LLFVVTQKQYPLWLIDGMLTYGSLFMFETGDLQPKGLKLVYKFLCRKELRNAALKQDRVTGMLKEDLK
jgi:hypothetical protein